MNISFWNTNLAPLFYSVPDAAKMNVFFDALELVLIKNKLDFIVLCEVNAEVIAKLKNRFKNWVILSAADNISKNLYFDMVVMHNGSVRILEKYPLYHNTNSGNGYNVKTGYNFLIKSSQDRGDDNSKITLVASHWPSILRDHSSFKKEHAARQLKKFCDIESTKSDRQIVLIGDYNEKPDSSSIKTVMYTTTNRHYASIASEVMYNLADSMSGPHQPNYHGVDYHFSGTWVSSNPSFREKENDSCQMFDQIIVQASMISKGHWVLNERESKIIKCAGVKRLVVDGVIDHFPIMLRIEKRR